MALAKATKDAKEMVQFDRDWCILVCLPLGFKSPRRELPALSRGAATGVEECAGAD